MLVKRKIIEIDEEKCDGCGECIEACHEGALALVDGKARLVKDSYCDGLGACLGECPMGAIRIIERTAEEFVEPAAAAPAHACPGAALRALAPVAVASTPGEGFAPPPSLLAHWPVQLALVPVDAPFLRGSDLVICADCVPFAVPDFHARYLQGRAVVIGCPKLDDLGGHAAKLEAIIARTPLRRLTVLRMEVPCCRGLVDVGLKAAMAVGGDYRVEEHVIGISGGITRRVVRA